MNLEFLSWVSMSAETRATNSVQAWGAWEPTSYESCKSLAASADVAEIVANATAVRRIGTASRSSRNGLMNRI
jgi:hypothetical protein